MKPSDGWAGEWLDSQSTRVRGEINAFRRREPDCAEEFLAQLAEYSVQLKSGNLKPLFEMWMNVPSRLALEIAAKTLTQKRDIEAFSLLAEKALLTKDDVAAFDECRQYDDPFEEHRSWLRDRAYINGLPTI